jgi:hypothetical protein
LAIGLAFALLLVTEVIKIFLRRGSRPVESPAVPAPAQA